MIRLLMVPVFAFLDRWGGGGFAFLGITTGPLSRGLKIARRLGIPLGVWLLNQTWEQAILCAIMAGILSTNLDEIAERKWDTVFLYGVALGFVLYPLAGLWALLVPAWWFGSVYWSNIGIWGTKIGWHWVELVRGALIGLALFLGR